MHLFSFLLLLLYLVSFSSSSPTLSDTAKISTIADCDKGTQNEFVLVDECDLNSNHLNNHNVSYGLTE